jgi:hypothetical protein
MHAHRWRRDLKDVGDQALMRGLDTAFPNLRPGLFPILQRASARAGHKASVGNSPAVVPPPPMSGRVLPANKAVASSSGFNLSSD